MKSMKEEINELLNTVTGVNSYVQHGIGQPAMKPTKEEYATLLTEWSKGTEKLRSCGYEEQMGVNVMRKREIVEHALRLAANMLSEDEIAAIIFTQLQNEGGTRSAARVILKRLGVER